MESKGEDLVSKLKKALNYHQVELEPASSPDCRVSCDYSDDSTLAYLTKMLLDDEEDDIESAQQQNSFEGLFDELRAIVASGSSGSESEKFTGKSGCIDVFSSLMQCGRAVAANDITGFSALAMDIKDAVANQSTVLDRVAVFFIEALIARIRGTGPQAFRSITAGMSSRRLRMDAKLPAFQTPLIFANEVILRACAGAKVVHIIDYGIHCGRQWPALIKALSRRAEGPPRLKMTGIDLVDVSEAQLVGQSLTSFARSSGVQLEYCSIVSNSWETVQPFTHPSEVLIVNSNNRLQHMKDEWVAVSNPRRLLFEKIYKMKPSLFVICVANVSLSAPFFLSKFEEALKYYIPRMESTDVWLAESSTEELELMEKIFQREIMAAVACDGLEQRERPDKYRTWDSRAKRAGFEPFPVDEEIYNRVKMGWGGFTYNSNYRCGRDENWVVTGWKDVILYGMSAWQTKSRF